MCRGAWARLYAREREVSRGSKKPTAPQPITGAPGHHGGQHDPAAPTGAGARRSGHQADAGEAENAPWPQLATHALAVTEAVAAAASAMWVQDVPSTLLGGREGRV